MVRERPRRHRYPDMLSRTVIITQDSRLCPRAYRRFGTVDFRVLPVQFRAQIDQLCTVLADESKG